MQNLLGDTRGVIPPGWSTNFVAICIEESDGTISGEGSSSTRVTALDEIA